MSYTKVANIKLNPKIPELPDGYTGTLIPRWLDEVPGLYPLKDVRIAAYIYSYNRNGQTCYVSDDELCRMFTISHDALSASLTRLKKTGILSIGHHNKMGRTLTIHQPSAQEPGTQASALDSYINARYKKRHPGNQVTAYPGNQDNPENQGIAYPENQENVQPGNQGHILKKDIEMNNIIQQDISTNVNNIIEGAEKPSKSEKIGTDIWSEWENWFKNSRRMKLPGFFVKYIRDNTDGASRIGIRDITSAFDKGYDPAAILEAAVEACNTAAPRTAMEEALAKRPAATEQFQAKSSEYLTITMEDAIRDFCQSKGMDVSTFRQAVGNKYGIDYLRSDKA